MAGYNTTTNTLSFLKFDKNPSASTVYDSMYDSPITWTKNNVYPPNDSLKIYKSRKYSMASSTINGQSSYLMTEIPTDNNLGLFDSRELDHISYGNMTLDFWFYPFKKASEKYNCRELMTFYGIDNSQLWTQSKFYYGMNYSIILSSYQTNSDTTIGVYIQTETSIHKNPNISGAAWFANSYFFKKIGEVNLNEWSHIALMRRGSAFSFAINGTMFKENVSGTIYKEFSFCNCNSYNESVEYYVENRAYVNSTGGARIVLGGHLLNDNTNLTGSVAGVMTSGKGKYWNGKSGNYMDIGTETQQSTIAFDNIRLSKDILWTDDFYPPGEIGKQFFVYDDYAYYNDPETGNILKLSFAKWSSISDSDKLILLDRVAMNDLPSVEQIKIIQTDPTKDIVCYNYQFDTAKPKLVIEKIDETSGEIVYPTKFMNYGSIQSDIENISASVTKNGLANVRLAVTRDGETYYTYNAVNSSWVPLDNKEDVMTDGIIYSSLKDIPKASWIQFDLSKFAFSIALVQPNESETCKIDDIKIKLNLESKWVKADKDNQAKYSYIGPTLLKISFLEDGKYKVNYNDRG